MRWPLHIHVAGIATPRRCAAWRASGATLARSRSTAVAHAAIPTIPGITAYTLGYTLVEARGERKRLPAPASACSERKWAAQIAHLAPKKRGVTVAMKLMAMGKPRTTSLTEGVRTSRE